MHYFAHYLHPCFKVKLYCQAHATMPEQVPCIMFEARGLVTPVHVEISTILVSMLEKVKYC